jgi:hypothetical protein
MMNAMGHPRRRAGRAVRAGVAGVAGAVVAVAALAAGCSTGSPPEEDRTPSAESAALRVQTVSGAERLDEQTRTEIEGEIGDALSDYVFEAFLGEFPRQRFVQAFESFTSFAAREATADIRKLTADSVRDATAVRATELDARLSLLTRGGTVHAGSADVHFSFEATMPDGSTRPLVLDGRFLLDGESGTWAIFGYDVTFDNGRGVAAETSTDTDPEEGS